MKTGALVRFARKTLLLFLVSVLAISCRRGDAAAQKDAALRIGVGLPASARERGLNVLTEALYTEPLIGLDTSGRPRPRLANDWAWENGNVTLRITLRTGVVLHDGRPLDATTTRGFLKAKVDARIKEHHRGSFANVKAIEAPDARTLLLHLDEADAFLVPELNNAYLLDPNSRHVATGPFMLVSEEPIIVERFDRYYRGTPAIRQVQIRPYDTQRAAWVALMRGEVDAVQEINRDAVEFLQRTPGVNVYASLRPFYWSLSFNLRHKALRSPTVRRALSKAVNREEIVASILQGRAMIAADPVWPLHWAYSRIAQQHSFDSNAARDLLLQTQRSNSEQTGLRLRCLFYSDDPLVEKMAMMVQRQLHEVGVTLDLQPAGYSEMTARLASGDFDTFLMITGSGRALDWTYRFWRSPRPGEKPLQAIGYTGADDVLDELRRAYSDEQVKRGVAKLRQRFFDDPPAVFIAWQQVTRVVSSRFDVSEADQQDIFANIWQWKPVTPTN